MYLYIYWPRQKQFIFQNAPDNILPEKFKTKRLWLKICGPSEIHGPRTDVSVEHLMRPAGRNHYLFFQKRIPVFQDGFKIWFRNVLWKYKIYTTDVIDVSVCMSFRIIWSHYRLLWGYVLSELLLLCFDLSLKFAVPNDSHENLLP